MDYQKITFKLIPDTQDFRDIVMNSLGEIGFESFVENDTSLEGYIQSSLWNEGDLATVNFEPMFSYTYCVEFIVDQNWNEVWEKNYFQPLLVSDRCLVRAPFHTEYPKAEFEIVIEPKMAFGTGNHETTSLMIQYILEMDFTGKIVLDMGCGTGILAMLCSMKGAEEIVAIDIDKWAFESSVENCALNNCTNITVYQGDATILGEKSFDIIFANIHKNILIEDVKKYASVLHEGGILLMSGFYESDLETISKEAELHGILYKSHKHNNKWVAASYRKNLSK